MPAIPPLFPPQATLFKLLNKAVRQDLNLPVSATGNQSQSGASQSDPENTETPNSELARIATALERIAASLEKLSGEQRDLSNETGHDDGWITLPDSNLPLSKESSSDTKPLLPLKIEQPATSKPASQPNSPANNAALAAPIKTEPQASQPKAKVPAINSKPAAKSPDPASKVQADAKSGKTPAPQAGKQSAPPMTTANNSVLLKYLKECDITIQERKKKISPQEQAYLDKLDKLALHLGKNFTECQELYQELKKNIVAPRNSFTYSLKGFSAEQNNKVQNFCRLLKEAELLEEYSYQKKPEYTVRLKASGKEQKYLCGAWLEHYVKQEVARIVKSYGNTKLRYEALANLEIIFKDTSKAELDLFFALGQEVFCVETKMRPSQAELENFLTRIKPLKLDNQALLIVVADKPEEDCQKLSQALGNVQIIRLANLEQSLTVLLKAGL
ncbi:MAG TPA: hypothetical protein VH186_27080 [Chloroflexia bacterium]|nr:hypothetical protein [Chloroflexia bacterium]